MSVDLSILVKHSFHETDDHAACCKFLTETIEHLKQYFCSDYIADDIRMEEYEYSFYLKPLDNVHIWLHNGCWEVETCFAYAAYFVKDENNRNGLRRLAFDLARAFNQSEAWITSEYNGWNGCLEMPSASFEGWLDSDSPFDGWSGEVVEYDPEKFPKICKWNDNYGPKYHDSFREQKIDFEELSEKFHGYELLTISPMASVILGKKNEKLYALSLRTNQLFVDYPIAGINANYNSMAIEIYRDEASALFSRNGDQLTPFGQHDFCWGWENGKSNVIKITDRTTGKSWSFPIFED